MSQEQQPTEGEQQQQKRLLAERVSFGIASLILVAIVGAVIYEWLTQKNRPPAIAVKRTGATRKVQDQFYIPFAVTNTGGQAADSVQVVAQLRIHGKVEATGEQQIDYLSKGETEQGAFIFDRNPIRSQPQARRTYLTSYELSATLVLVKKSDRVSVNP